MVECGTENLYISCILLVLLRLCEFSCYMLQWTVLQSGALPKEVLNLFAIECM